MPSPFPGMDPFLEGPDVWPVFHHHVVTTLCQVLLAQLSPRYRAQVRERRYTTEPHPDAPGAGHERSEEHIEIYQTSGSALVTLVDAVSPANKTTQPGRRAYLHTRRQARDMKANLVEIDLVLQGQPTLEYSRAGLPDWDYAVTVTRASHPERYEIYTATLQKRLPRFRLPLADDDRDTILDLQSAFTRAYEQGGFAGQIDYRHEPAVVLKDPDRRWLREQLSLPVQPAETPLTHDEIARAAYDIWKEQGCPDGRADEHWRLAIERLERARKAPNQGPTSPPVTPS